MRDKIAFFKIGSFSHTNERLLHEFEKHFSEYQVETIDVARDMVFNRRSIVLLNQFFVVKEYGLEILQRRKRIRSCFWRTPYIFQQVKAIVSNHLSRDKYAFSFQTQSLFDASVPGLPHFLYTDHTHLANLYYPHFDSKKLFSTAWVELEKQIYQNATINFTMSANIRDSMINQYSCDPDKVVCLYAGTNSQTNLTMDNGNYGNKNILFVGIDWERKGGPDLVEAFKLVSKTFPDARLTIVGCSPQVDVPNVNVVGRIPVEEVNRYYQQATVFCLPTKQEPFGYVLLEASKSKLPVVATDIGAIPEIVVDGESGHLVKPGDVEQLAGALVDLIGNPEKCRAFGEMGNNRVLKRYSWESVGIALKQNIKSAL